MAPRRDLVGAWNSRYARGFGGPSRLLAGAAAVGQAIAAKPFTSLAMLSFTGVAGLALVGAMVFDGEATVLFLANGAALLFAVWLYKKLERAAPDREIGLLRLALLLQYMTSVMLVVAAFVGGGDLPYLTGDGVYSHQTGSIGVALANAVFMLAMSVPALIRPTRGRPPVRLRLDVAPAPLTFLLLVAAAVVILRGALLFVPQGAPEVPVYFARLYVTYFGATIFFVGVALRRGSALAFLTAAGAGGVSVLTLFAGSRWDSITLVGLIAVGYLVAGPLNRRKLLLLASVATPLLVGALFVGEAVRQDHGERSGAAALDRMDNLSNRIAFANNRDSMISATVGRLVSNSQHAVLTRVPAELPFEGGGLMSLSADIVDSFLPRFYWTGQSDSERPRNWMLNDLGFLVNWRTSVELPLLADAWYRGGWFALLVIGVLSGTLLEVVERMTYRVASRRPEGALLLLVLITLLPSFLARDIVWGIRTMLFNMSAAAMLLLVVRILSGRGPVPARK